VWKTKTDILARINTITEIAILDLIFNRALEVENWSELLPASS